VRKGQALKGCWMCTERNVEFGGKRSERRGTEFAEKRREELAIFKIEAREGIGFEMANAEEASVESPKKPNGGGASECVIEFDCASGARREQMRGVLAGATVAALDFVWEGRSRCGRITGRRLRGRTRMERSRPGEDRGRRDDGFARVSVPSRS